MKGKILAVSDKGKWNSYKLGEDDWYSLWKDKGEFSKGDYIEFDYEVSGNFKNITKVISWEPGSPDTAGTPGAGGSSGNQGQSGAEMRRMSALKSAIALINAIDVPVEGAVDFAIETAKRFSRFIMGKESMPEAGETPNDKDAINVRLKLAGITPKDFEEFMFSQHGIDFDNDDLSKVAEKINEYIDHYKSEQQSSPPKEDDIPF